MVTVYSVIDNSLLGPCITHHVHLHIWTLVVVSDADCSVNLPVIVLSPIVTASFN